MKGIRYVWHLHHETLLEPVGKGCDYQTMKERRESIVRNKPSHEHETRLRLIRYVKGPLPAKILARTKAYVDDYEAAPYGSEMPRIVKGFTGKILALHAKECKDCPWEGRILGTIFP